MVYGIAVNVVSTTDQYGTILISQVFFTTENTNNNNNCHRSIIVNLQPIEMGLSTIFSTVFLIIRKT